ncbi:hypothetical protein BKP35_00500 [Anaerobacillus arseniciselenatis]|uniref:DUF4367 domain-containing protein n=1 Tax=Anaerobacillus arseniciselenatis TaxID=85682 RepID=A0A1S2LSK6_9BACI|nr:hypothetical protein [Anaerobacillus arseniciselenatis]OIJ15509.1 hypothetical protein BKP35_00500 [Anaerobacillus arseniciselenatis]
MKNNHDDFDKKLEQMPKPSLNDEKKREMHEAITEFSQKYEEKQRRGFFMKRFAASIGGVAIAAVAAFFIITSLNEETLDIVGDEPQPDYDQTEITGDEPNEREEDATDQKKDETGNEKSDDQKQDPDEYVVNPLQKYDVFSDYNLYHPSYLSEAREFYQSENTDYVLAYGHQAHAVTRYELFAVKEDEVTIIRSVVDDADYERIESILHLDNWKEAMIEYLLDEAEPIEETFFTYDEQQSKEEVTVEGQTYMLYPVVIDDEKTFYFKEGEGIWVKFYSDQATIDMYGEEQKVFRINENE